MSDPRRALTRARRVVVKIGSRGLKEDPRLIERLAGELAASRASRSFVIVSSGAIALGAARLGYPRRPREMAELQASAAVGQGVLMRRYDEAFSAVGLVPAQVLLTHADLSDRVRLNNARAAFAALLDAGAIPIVNENDTVATEEIAFGDNDQLASMVAPLVGADLLVLLTDVTGVLDGAGNRIARWQPGERAGDAAALALDANRHGSGGMTSKLSAAEKASRSGASVVIASAREERTLERILAGEDVGTLLAPAVTALRARQHWIAYTLRPRGTILLDDGAVAVVRAGRSSLLPVGVLGVRGEFHAGDAVRLTSTSGREIGRGLTRLSALEVARTAGQRGAELELRFGSGARDWLVIHKDDLVVTDEGDAA